MSDTPRPAATATNLPQADPISPATTSGPPAPATTSAESQSSSAYFFPIRSEAARFSKGHHTYPATDIFAPCGSAVVAVAAGVVSEVSRTDTWNARKNAGDTRGGLSVSIVGVDGVRYYGSHLSAIEAEIVPGATVQAGALLGQVGRTGSAANTPCHLHFGISPACGRQDWWTRRGVIAPYPFLTSWRRGEQRSPASAVADWRSTNGCPTEPEAR